MNPRSGLAFFRRASGSTLLIFFFLMIAAVGTFAEGESEAGMSNGGVNASVTYNYSPDNQVWAAISFGLPDNPVGFRYEPVCFDDQENGDIACLAQYGVSCTAAPDGRLVWWFSGFKDSDPLSWARLGDSPSCIYSEDPAAFEERLRAEVLRAFQQAPIAPGTMILQPSPHTLVGANTNVYVEARPQVFEMNLLGQSIRIEVEPTEYTFDYGDGMSYGPVSTPGASLPEARWGEQTATSHIYSQTGDFAVTVMTFFSGAYSVNGGPMISMDDRAEVASLPQLLSVWRSESLNVADNCMINPAGVGC